MPKRPRPGGRRSAAGRHRKERRRSTPGRAGPSLTLTPMETAEAPRHAEISTSGSSIATASVKPAARHMGKDYGYVFGELRRIAIIMAIIVGGLVAAAVILR